MAPLFTPKSVFPTPHISTTPIIRSFHDSTPGFPSSLDSACGRVRVWWRRQRIYRWGIHVNLLIRLDKLLFWIFLTPVVPSEMIYILMVFIHILWLTSNLSTTFSPPRSGTELRCGRLLQHSHGPHIQDSQSGRGETDKYTAVHNSMTELTLIFVFHWYTHSHL